MPDCIPEGHWKWFGNAGHFCGGNDCRFHLCTEVSGYLVTTIGEWISERVKGDQKEFEAYPEYVDCLGFYEKDGETLKGYYETMVFRVAGHCSQDWCGKCGRPDFIGLELYCQRYSTAKEANYGHMLACYKASSGDFNNKEGV